MNASFLTVDIGNTRCKLRRWSVGPGRASELTASGEFDSQRGSSTAMLEWLAGLDAVEGAAVACVAAPDIENEFVSVLADRLGARVVRSPEHGLAIRTHEPNLVGRDRLFAARGACERVRGSSIVVDAGTALTVDAVRMQHTDGAPAEFLGGAIAAGPNLLAQALASGTARLPRVVPRPSLRALGRDTREAIVAGIGVGFRGAVRELVNALASDAELENAPIVLTGGAREFLLEPNVFEPRHVLIEPELVHLGLLIASGFRLPEPAAR